MNWRRFFIVGAVVLALAAMLGLSAGEPAVRVETAAAVREPFAESVHGEGIVRARDRYTVSAPISGTLARIPFKAGQAFERGDVVARLMPALPMPLDARARSEAQARLEIAQTTVKAAAARERQASANHAFAQAELARAQDLYDESESVLSRAELERAQRDQSVASEELAAARFAQAIAGYEAEIASIQLRAIDGSADPSQAISLRAPVAGVVYRVIEESERVVMSGAPLIEMGPAWSSEIAEVVVDLLSSDAVKVEPGDAASLSRWGGEGELEAIVDRIEPSGFTKISALGVEEQRVNVVLRASSAEGWSSLGDGYRAEAQIFVGRRTQALLVPASAAFRDGSGWAVFVADGSTAKLRRVRIGKRSSTRIEILEGVSEGERVILHPSKDVFDGGAIELREQP